MARILLVDDDDDSRFAVREAIRLHTQHDVAEATDGAATLRRVEAEGAVVSPARAAARPA